MPANVIAETNGMKLVHANGTETEFRLNYDITAMGGQPRIRVQAYRNGSPIGQPIRFHDADGRIAADLPGVSDTYFITQDGSIANG